jgi:hypothetical protein
MVTYPIFFHHLSTTTTITGSTAQLHYGMNPMQINIGK